MWTFVSLSEDLNDMLKLCRAALVAQYPVTQATGTIASPELMGMMKVGRPSDWISVYARIVSGYGREV